MIMYKALHPRAVTFTDYMCQEKKEEEDLPALKKALRNRYNDLKTS